jgi:anthranilate synthase component I
MTAGKTGTADQALIRETVAAGKPALLWRRRIADTDTPVSVALKTMDAGRGDFILESVEGGETRGRHSLVGLAPDLVFRADGSNAEINVDWANDRTAFTASPLPALDALRALAGQCRMDVPDILPPALACLVGYFGYETIGLVEKLPRAKASDLEVPDMLFVRPTVILVFDRLKDELFLVAPIWPDIGQTSEKLIMAANERLDLVEQQIGKPLPHPSHTDQECTAALDDLALTPVLADGEYRNMVLRAKDYIEAGDIFQVVLAQRFTAPFTLPPIDLYRALRRINPSPFFPRSSRLFIDRFITGNSGARPRR